MISFPHKDTFWGWEHQRIIFCDSQAIRKNLGRGQREKESQMTILFLFIYLLYIFYIYIYLLTKV